MDWLRHRRSHRHGAEYRHHTYGQHRRHQSQHRRQKSRPCPLRLQHGRHHPHPHRPLPRTQPHSLSGRTPIRHHSGLQLPPAASSHCPLGHHPLPHLFQRRQHHHPLLLHPPIHQNRQSDGQTLARGDRRRLPPTLHQRRLHQHRRTQPPGRPKRDTELLQTHPAHVHLPAQPSHRQGRR